MVLMKRLILPLIIVLLLPSLSFAHQPRLVMGMENSEENPILVETPEISQAFYGELNGSPGYYKLVSEKPFVLYVNVLVPDIENFRSYRFSAVVYDSEKNPVISINGNDFAWKRYFESFAGDWYLQGPETKKYVPAGTYYLRVFNSENIGKYSLAIGEEESFPPEEIINAIILVPEIKQKFFGYGFIESYLNFSGVAIVMLIAVIAIILIFLLRTRKKANDKNVK